MSPTGGDCAARSDGRLERGNAKRRAILDRAVDLASVSGLETLSLGRLATELGISKSGALLHFGSKLDLQLAVIGHAAERFVTAVVVPAEQHPAGLERLRRLADGWLHHIEAGIFPGGCFFATVGAEFGSRPGPVHDAIAEAHTQWIALLEKQATVAGDTGQLRAGVEPRQLSFQLDAVIRHANLHRQLHDRPDAIADARTAVVDFLSRAATAESAKLLPSQGGAPLP